MGNPGSPLRGTVVLGSSVTDNGSGVGTVGYEYSPAGANSWTATSASWNTTLVADGHYDLHVVATDVAGNAVTSTAVTNVRVDNSAPSVSLNDPGSPIGGSITLDVTGSDGGSGLASVVYQRSLVGQNSWTTIGTASSSPFSLGFDTTVVSDGSYDLRAVATDAAGNSTTSALVGGRVIDNTPADVLIGAPVNGAYLNSIFARSVHDHRLEHRPVGDAGRVLPVLEHERRLLDRQLGLARHRLDLAVQRLLDASRGRRPARAARRHDR